jgi:hypothetical protein
MRLRHISQMLFALPVAALFLLGVQTSAAASPPDREPVVLPSEPFVFTNACGFEVTLQVLSNNEVITTFERKSGTTSIHVTGTLKVRLTTVSGGSVDLNISGPTHSTINPDGSTTQIALGRALWAFDPGVGPGLPRLALISGRTVSTFDPAFTLGSVSGHVEDMCSALSAS